MAFDAVTATVRMGEKPRLRKPSRPRTHQNQRFLQAHPPSGDGGYQERDANEIIHHLAMVATKSVSVQLAPTSGFLFRLRPEQRKQSGGAYHRLRDAKFYSPFARQHRKQEAIGAARYGRERTFENRTSGADDLNLGTGIDGCWVLTTDDASSQDDRLLQLRCDSQFPLEHLTGSHRPDRLCRYDPDRLKCCLIKPVDVLQRFNPDPLRHCNRHDDVLIVHRAQIPQEKIERLNPIGWNRVGRRTNLQSPGTG